MTQIIIVKNQTTVLSDAEVQAALPAFQTQITTDFAPAYGTPASIAFAGKTDPVPAGAILVVMLDNADQAGALGYHDMQKSGDPIAKVFVKTTQRYGGIWTVTASHEILEALADPLINLTVLNDQSWKLYAYEVCDAVEADVLGYTIGETQVSDFVLPHYFDEHRKSGTPLSYRGHVTKPFSLAKGGYLSYLDLRTGQWKQIMADIEPPPGAVHSALEIGMRRHDSIARPGSRRERRTRGHQQWQHSLID